MSKRATGGWVAGEGEMAANIGGEVGSISPNPTFIPPGSKKLFCPKVKMLIVLKFEPSRCSNDFF